MKKTKTPGALLNRSLAIVLIAFFHSFSGLISPVQSQNPEKGSILVVADQDLQHLNVLQSGLRENAIWVDLDKSMDPLSALEMAIRDHAPVRSLHLLTHGKPGALVFSYDEINTQTIQQNNSQLSAWGELFSDNGSVILYGCEVGKGNEGLTFVHNLAQVTNLHVAASENLTGSSSKGGDWIFEITTGSIETPAVFSEASLSQYPEVLGNVLVFDIDGTAIHNGNIISNFYSELAGHSGVMIQTSIPELDGYDMVYIVQPTRPLSDQEISNLKQFLIRGGLIIFQGEHGGYTPSQNNNISNAAMRLGSGLSIINEATDGGWSGCNNDMKASGVIRDWPFFQNVNTIEFNYIAPVALGGNGQVMIRHRSDISKTFMAIEKVDNGHIIMFADQNVWDRVSASNCNNNAIFFENLLKFSMSNIQQATATVIHENIHAPVIEPGQVFMLDENSLYGVIAGVVEASDEDGETEFGQWTIVSGNKNEAFSIDPETGAITVNNSVALDYETITEFILVVTVSDGEHTSEGEAVTIQLNNLNDTPPVIAANQTFTIDEKSINGTFVGEVQATDADGPTIFQDWTIVSGDSGQAFHLDAATGVITVSNSESLDYKTSSTFTLTVSVSDGVHIVEEVIVIMLNEVATATPEDIVFNGDQFEEGMGVGSEIGVFITVDTQDNHHQYALVPGEGDADNRKFRVEGERLISVSEFSYDFQRTFTIRVRSTNSVGEYFEKPFRLTLEPKPVVEKMIPTAFSPNGDYVNDTWEIDYLTAYPNSYVKVFNTEGVEVFSDRGYSRQWDGTFNGRSLPFGTYYYVIHLNGDNSSILKGTVMIIK